MTNLRIIQTIDQIEDTTIKFENIVFAFLEILRLIRLLFVVKTIDFVKTAKYCTTKYCK